MGTFLGRTAWYRWRMWSLSYMIPSHYVAVTAAAKAESWKQTKHEKYGFFVSFFPSLSGEKKMVSAWINNQMLPHRFGGHLMLRQHSSIHRPGKREQFSIGLNWDWIHFWASQGICNWLFYANTCRALSPSQRLVLRRVENIVGLCICRLLECEGVSEEAPFIGHRRNRL